MNDFRLALRSLVRTPSFTIAAVIALGLGIGSTASVFSLLEGIVLRPLPYAHPGQLAMLWENNGEKKLMHQQISPVNFVDYRAMHTSFDDAAAWWRPQLNLQDDLSGDPIRVTAVETSENLFRVLGVAPAVGHDFANDTTLMGIVPEAIISNRLWKSRFGGDRGVIGRIVRLNGYGYTLVGVMPPGFDFPGDIDVWEGLAWPLEKHSRAAHFMESVVRMRPGVAPEQANRELASLSARLGKDFPSTNGSWKATVVTLDQEVAGVFRPALFALFGASGLLLLIACLNIANLLLARATVRQREIAVRAALGASRWRLVRLFLAENFVLAAAGAVLGIAVAMITVRGLLAWSPIRIPRADDVHVDGAVLLFAMLAAFLTTVVFGLLPAWIMSQVELHGSMKIGARGAASRGARSALVVIEVALAVVLLSGAGLLTRSVARLLAEDIGVDATTVVTANLQLPDRAYPEWERSAAFYANLGTALRARPEVAAAGTATFLPLEAGWRMPFRPFDAAPTRAGEEPQSQIHSVDEGYFAALRIPTVRGRTFTEHDDVQAPAVIVVNETMARQTWPGQDAVGKRVYTLAVQIGPLGRKIHADSVFQVIGVVRDVKNTSLRAAAEPAMYYSIRQFPFRKMNVVIRGRLDAAQLTAVLREEVRKLDPSLPLGDVKSLTRVLAESVDPPRFIMAVMGVFALLAVTLAAVGIYGILTYAVTHRRREIGIRLALGAQRGTILRMILGEGLGLAAAGCAIGLVGAFAGGRALSGFLYGVSPWDVPTMLAVSGIVTLVALAACVLPGRRAAGEDPAAVLRGD